MTYGMYQVPCGLGCGCPLVLLFVAMKTVFSPAYDDLKYSGTVTVMLFQ